MSSLHWLCGPRWWCALATPRLQHAKKEGSMSPRQAVILTGATDGTVRPHLPDQAVFKPILAEEIDWKPLPASPPSVRLAVVVGQPLQDGPCTIRVKVPRGAKVMPHRHSGIYTVISGIFYIGLGDQFDAEKLGAYPPVAVIVLPGDIALRSAPVGAETKWAPPAALRETPAARSGSPTSRWSA